MRSPFAELAERTGKQFPTLHVLTARRYVGRHRAEFPEIGQPEPDAAEVVSGTADPSAADLPAWYRRLRFRGRPGVLEQEQGDVVVELATDPLDERALQ